MVHKITGYVAGSSNQIGLFLISSITLRDEIVRRLLLLLATPKVVVALCR